MAYKRILPCLAFAALASTAVRADEVPAPQTPAVQLRAVTFNGSGCRPGDPTPEISAEGNTLSVGFVNFQAGIGPGIAAVENRKNCVISLNIAVPAGWSYALGSYEFRGYMSLDAGIKGEFITTSFFEGASGSGQLATSWTGPQEMDYVLKDSIGVAALKWSPCGLERRLTLNTQLRLSNVDKKNYPNSYGMLTLEDFYLQKLSFLWKKC